MPYIAQAVSCWLLAVEAVFNPRAMYTGFCEQNGMEVLFQFSPVDYHPTTLFFHMC
jgi:hypothetical protein